MAGFDPPDWAFAFWHVLGQPVRQGKRALDLSRLAEPDLVKAVTVAANA